MTNTEKLADDLGQIIFRLETNWGTLQRRAGVHILPEEISEDKTFAPHRALSSDIERLKDIKERILTPEWMAKIGPAGTCRICGETSGLRHVNLYVSGSEGLDVCHDCEMVIVNEVRAMITISGRSRKVGYLAAKKVQEAKHLQELKNEAHTQQQQ